MTLWDHLCCVGYGIQARADAVWHMLRGHRVRWFGAPCCIEPWAGHFGCITCVECPDSSVGEDGKHNGVVFWMNESRIVWWLSRRLCGWLGHSELRHPKVPLMGLWAYKHDEWYCYRCMDTVDAIRTKVGQC